VVLGATRDYLVETPTGCRMRVRCGPDNNWRQGAMVCVSAATELPGVEAVTARAMRPKINSHEDYVERTRSRRTVSTRRSGRRGGPAAVREHAGADRAAKKGRQGRPLSSMDLRLARSSRKAFEAASPPSKAIERSGLRAGCSNGARRSTRIVKLRRRR